MRECISIMLYVCMYAYAHKPLCLYVRMYVCVYVRSLYVSVNNYIRTYLQVLMLVCIYVF